MARAFAAASDALSACHRLFSPTAPVYRPLGLSHPEKIQIAAEFASVALRHAYWGYQVGICGAAYKKHLPQAASEIKADAFAFLRVIRHMREAMEALAAQDEFLSCVFDERENATRFYQSWKTLKKKRLAEKRWFASIAFGDDQFILPLQAADLLGASALRPPDDRIAHLFDAPKHPLYGKQILREVWDEEGFTTHPDIEDVKARMLARTQAS